MPPHPDPSAALPEDSQRRVRRWRGFELSAFQIEAVQAIRGGSNVLVSAPTGAGKTLVAEYAIEEACKRGRRAVFTAPIKALSNQKYRDFKAADVDVGLCTGDVTINATGQVLVMTTEILRNAIFEDPDYLRDVDFVVFDEIHYLDDAERGTVWEECLIFAPPDVRFVCLSATIANIDEIGAWIEEIRPHGLVTIESEKRPVPLEHHLFMPGKGVFSPTKAASLRKQLASKKSSGPKKRRSHDRQRGRPGPPDPRPLIQDLCDRGELPALVFAFSRKECERLARGALRRGKSLLDAGETRRMEALHEQLAEQYQLPPERLRSETFTLARGGVAYHHAGLLPLDKELVERMFTTGLIKLLFATETFALGINMPARCAVFPSLRKFDGVSVDWLRTRDYLQMAGRAGRQGLDDVGRVYSVLSERDLANAPLERIFSGRPEPVLSRFRLSYSTILHLVERLGRKRISEAWEKSLNRFQHREQDAKAREKNRKSQKRVVDGHLEVLREFDYLDEHDRLTARGRIAQKIPGFEVQTTEMLFRGVLENLPPRALAMIFVAQIFEERRPGGGRFVPQRMFGDLRRSVDRVQGRVFSRELKAGLPHTIKRPDWGLTPGVLAFCEGAPLEELERHTDASLGDVCRTFRMALQLMRQVRRAIDPSWDLNDSLADAMRLLDRDEVDARRQLDVD